MKIVSFDPASLRNLGWCSLDINGSEFEIASGTFVIDRFEEKWQPFWPMMVAIEDFLQKEKPSYLIVEETSQFFGKNFVTGQISHCIGIIFALAGKYNINVQTVYPTSVKKLVTGNGRATKPQVKKAVQNILKKIINVDAKFTTFHEVDATANIFAWLVKQGMIEI